MTHRPADHEIELANGHYLDLSDPDWRVIDVDVIAHALANTGRYAGHTSKFYSVAEHAVLVSERLEHIGASTEVQLVGLHHDDAEAFVADIARPLKSLLRGYGEIEDRLHRACRKALHLPHLTLGEDHQIKKADDWALSYEAYKLMPSKGRGWWCDGLYDVAEGYPWPRTRLGYWPEEASQAFLARHRALEEKLCCFATNPTGDSDG